MSEEIPAVSAALVPGSRIAGYVLLEHIDRGGMAVVFLARDERLDRQVALKILDPSLAADEAFRARFIRESHAAAAVDDPHIIPVFDAGEAGGVLFIAMRYVRGGNVGSLVRRRGPLPPARATEIVSQVASALDAAHRRGLVHRDVKPTNMLLDADSDDGRPDHVYLSDFGLSKTALGPNSLTRTGQFLGTLAYVAPEQIEGKPVDGRADQYALACAAFELLCGSPPFDGDDIAMVLEGHLHRAPPRATSRQPGLPPAVDAVLERALAKNPAKRYSSCRELSDALRDALAPAPPTVPPRTVRASAWRSTASAALLRRSGSGSGVRADRKKRSWAAAAIAAVVAVATAVAVLVWAPWRPPSHVLPPTGLTAGASTASSVALSWSGPASGPTPDRYVIWQDSVAIGSVTGTVTTYQARGLDPGTAYRYQVQAVLGSRSSARSATLTASTLTPPVSAARLAGTWTTQFQVVTASSYDGFFKPAGTKWTAQWVFSPRCAVGACDVTLSGDIIDNHSFAATMTRAGAVYTAAIHLDNFEYCGYFQGDGARYPIDDQITIQITVGAAHADGAAWTATAWSGTFTMNSPYTPTPTGPISYCPAYTVQADVSGAG